MFLHQGARQRLCEAISNHFCGRGSNERNDPILNIFPNDMTPDINVFRTSPSNRVQGQINGTLVITMDWDGVVDNVLKFREEALVPSGLVSRISHGHISGFCGVLGHCLLLSQGPAYSTVCKQEHIARGGVSVISLIGQTGISVAMKAISIGAIVDKAFIHSSH